MMREMCTIERLFGARACAAIAPFCLKTGLFRLFAPCGLVRKIPVHAHPDPDRTRRRGGRGSLRPPGCD